MLNGVKNPAYTAGFFSRQGSFRMTSKAVLNTKYSALSTQHFF